MGTNVKSYTNNQLLNRVKGLPLFKGYPKGFWIIGVRSNEDEPNHFDDKFYLFRGEEFIMVTSGTTNPGATILKGGYKHYNPLGAAVVKADEIYYDVWKFGKHKGKTDAFLQTGSKIKVYRDGDNDGKSEELGLLMEGFYGINFHPNTHDLTREFSGEMINDWSAGCQVCNNIPQYKKIIELTKAGKTLSYCLLNEF